MTAIFVSHTKEDNNCADLIRQSLEAKSYTVWQEPPSLTLESLLYPRTIENVILSSAAVVLIWSKRASQSEWVERQILFAQQLRKLIVPVLLDSTELPSTLVAVSPITSQGSCTDVVTQLVSMLPSAGSNDVLLALSEQAAHQFLRERKAAIEQAAQMLKQNEHREEVLSILEYLARHDLMMGVREKAQEVLNTSQGVTTSPTLHPGESRHLFWIHCKNGHISKFDKRHVCSATRPELRGLLQRAGKELDELHLACDTCGVEVVAHVDCEGYK